MKKILLWIGIGILLTGCQKTQDDSTSKEYNVHLKGKEPTFYHYENTLDSLAQYHSFEKEEDINYPAFPQEWYFITSKEQYDEFFKDFPIENPFLYSESFFNTHSLVGKYNVINNYATTDQELMFGIHEIDVQDQTVCLSIYKSIVGVVNLNYKNNYMLLGFEDPGKNKNYNYQTNIVYDFYYTEEMLQTPGLF